MSIFDFNEDTLEQASLEILESLGYEYIHGKELSPNAEFPQRESFKEVILKDKVKDALFKINRDLPQEALEQAYRAIISFNSPSPIHVNCKYGKLSAILLKNSGFF